MIFVAFDSDSKYFMFVCFFSLNFSFVFFQLLFLLYSFFFFLTYVLLPCLLGQAIHRLCHHLLEGLLLCAVVPIIISLFGVCPIFKARTTAFYFFVFLSFLF